MAVGIDGTWNATNTDAANPVVAERMRSQFRDQRPGPGQTVATAPRLSFLFQQQGANISGTFHDDKVFTCEFTGTVSGNRVSIQWQTAFHWLNIHEGGSAELALSPDGKGLSGRFSAGSISGAWQMVREAAPPQNTPVAAAPPVAVAPPAAAPPPPFRAPPPRPPASPPKPPVRPYVPYRDRILKEVWDAKYDKPLFDRLLKRAKVEKELHDLMVRKGLIKDPKADPKNQPKKKP